MKTNLDSIKDYSFDRQVLASQNSMDFLAKMKEKYVTGNTDKKVSMDNVAVVPNNSFIDYRKDVFERRAKHDWLKRLENKYTAKNTDSGLSGNHMEKANAGSFFANNAPSSAPQNSSGNLSKWQRIQAIKNYIKFCPATEPTPAIASTSDSTDAPSSTSPVIPDCVNQPSLGSRLWTGVKDVVSGVKNFFTGIFKR